MVAFLVSFIEIPSLDMAPAFHHTHCNYSFPLFLLPQEFPSLLLFFSPLVLIFSNQKLLLKILYSFETNCYLAHGFRCGMVEGIFCGAEGFLI